MNDAIETLRAQLQQLKELHDAGTLGTPAYEAARAPLERRLIDLVTGAPAVAATPVAQAAVAAQASTPLGAAAESAAPARPSGRLVGGLAVVVIAVAVAGYSWTGAPSLIGKPPVAAAPGGEAAPPHAQAPTQAQITEMVDKLAQRLKDKPDDAEGWTMLARAYMVLDRAAEAVPAYEKAVALRPDDASLLADYADTLAMQNGRRFDGEPTKVIERALKIDPANLKALALAGTAAFDRKDFPLAVQHWEKLMAGVPADSAYRGQVQSGIDEARQLAGMPPSPGAGAGAGANAAAAAAAPAPAPNDAAAPAAAAGTSVSGTVTLAAALAAQAGPTDTVFVFARAAEGPRMPLAVLRKQVKDLPFEFRLDDSMAMSPAAKLSGAPRVIVGARISKTGDAIPQDGDLSGESAPVAPGASGLKIEIASVVRK